MDYEFWLSPEATRTLMGSDRRLRVKMEMVLQRLASAPFGEPDFREKSPAGRIYDKVFRRHHRHLLGGPRRQGSPNY